MSKEKIKVYLYTRVSTSIQIDGYSLEAQKSRMKAFALYNDYEIVGEYEDAGKSGKSIEGRVQFTRMMEDIKSGKDGVSFVLVFKLSRFARNAADVLSTLQTMQDFGVNLICVEDGIDSSKDAGKLMISVLSAVAEIERENIRVQTMEGRIQKAREGKWNGGFAPYGYQLIDGKLIINEEEAVAIRTIFDQYVNTTIGANGLSKYLENHGIRKIPRQNGKNPLFDAGLIRKILKNPVYNGKIAFGRRTLEKVHGTRNEYKQVEQDEYLIAEGIHEAIISDELWQAAQVKLKSQAKKYEHVNKGKDTRTHLLSGIVKCPICGVGMFGNKCIKKKKDGTKYKDFYYYGCKHRHMIRGHKCTYNKQIREELLDDAVAEVIIKIVSNPKFASMMQEKINMKVDTSEIEKEIDNYQKELRKSHSTKFKLIEEIDNLDADDKHYKRRKQDLDDRLYRMYDKIEDLESLLIDAKAKKQTIEAEKLTGDNIYKILIYFDKLYKVMNDVERRQLITALISEIQIYEEKQPNGQWLKSITFKLPIIDEDLNIGLDNDEQVDSMETSLAHLVPEFTANLVGPVLLLIYMFILDWKLALLSLVPFAIGMSIMMGTMNEHYKEMYAKSVKIGQKMNNSIVEYIGGIEVIKTFNQSENSYKKYSDSVYDNAKFFYNWMGESMTKVAIGRLLSPMGILTVIPFGVFFYIHGSISLPSLITLVVLSFATVSSLVKIMNYMDDLSRISTITGEIGKILDSRELENKDKNLIT